MSVLGVCDRCHRQVDVLDLVRAPAGAMWEGRRIDLCPNCASVVRVEVLGKRVAIALVLGVGLVVVFAAAFLLLAFSR